MDPARKVKLIAFYLEHVFSVAQPVPTISSMANVTHVPEIDTLLQALLAINEESIIYGSDNEELDHSDIPIPSISSSHPLNIALNSLTISEQAASRLDKVVSDAAEAASQVDEVFTGGVPPVGLAQSSQAHT